MVDFARAIELVAEQVQQHDEVGLQLGHDLGQPQLVALEHAPVGGAGVQQRACDAGIEIGARAVARDGFTGGLERVCEQVRDRRLAVRPDNHDGSLGHPRLQVRDEVRVNDEARLAGEVGRRPVSHVCERPGRHGSYGFREPEPHVRGASFFALSPKNTSCQHRKQ